MRPIQPFLALLLALGGCISVDGLDTGLPPPPDDIDTPADASAEADVLQDAKTDVDPGTDARAEEADARATVNPIFGVAGPYANVQLSELRSRGVGALLHELSWADLAPYEGAFDVAKLETTKSLLAQYAAAGLKVVLDLGLQTSPGWILGKANGHFAAQDTNLYGDSPIADLVFPLELRPFAESYIASVLDGLGADGGTVLDSLLAVRVGGGQGGALSYPVITRGTAVDNKYWAFSDAAKRTNPVVGWTPGTPSPNGEASKFWAWYVDSLTGFQNWQIATVRAHYTGLIAVSYPGKGARTSDIATALAANLNGNSIPEQQGELPRGNDIARHIAAIADPQIAVICGLVENADAMGYVASLADAKGFPKMGQNVSQTAADMVSAVDGVKKNELSLLIWYDAQALYFGGPSKANIGDYQGLIVLAGSE
jgi:hypothetical protein